MSRHQNRRRKKEMTEPKILSFKSVKAWEVWLGRHHKSKEGIWLRFYKKSSGIVSLTYDEALEGALCYGWIDGQIRPFDEKSWIRKFTPRRPKSLWSKRNIEHVQRLTRAGRMKPPGIREVNDAKADGRWKNAYDPHSTMTLPADFLERLGRNKKSKAFFEKLNRANVYAIAWRLQTAKRAETREKRMQEILRMLSRGEKFHA